MHLLRECVDIKAMKIQTETHMHTHIHKHTSVFVSGGIMK